MKTGKAVLSFSLLVCLLLSEIECSCDASQFSCQTPDGKYGTCVNGTCTQIQAEVRNKLQFTIEVKYPETNIRAHNGQELYIRGNALGFNWMKGEKINKTSSDTWRVDIIYQSASDGFRCQYCSVNASFTGEFFEYRLYIDDKVDMVGGNLQLKLPVSMTSSYFNDTPVFHAYPWFFSKRGSVTILPIQSPQIGKLREIVVYRPPSFEENTYKTYPIMIVFDLNADVSNASLEMINTPIAEKGTVGEFIAIGYGDYQPIDERFSLLTQVDSPGFPFLCKNGTPADGCGHCLPDGNISSIEYFRLMETQCGRHETLPSKGNDTLDFLIQTVLPKAKTITNSRMLTDQPNLGVMGYSLGGLMACHAAWTMPNIFGYAACQSPSFWWPIINATNAAFFFSNVTMKDQSLRTKRPYQRIYLDAGGTETAVPSTLTQAMVAAAEDMHSTGFFEWNKNLWMNVFPGDIHSSRIWLTRLWTPLRIFFPTNPPPKLEDFGGSNCVSQRPPVIVG